MSISNPKPAQISGGTWSLEAGINRFTVNIPTEPVDNDLAGVIIIAKAGSSPSYPADVVYKGPWSDFILIDTDASNSALLPNTSYTVGIAAYDGFGSDVADVNFGATEKSVTTLQVVSADVADNAVTEAKISTDAVTSSKISSNAVTEAKISTNAVTNSKISTNAVTNSKIFDVSGDKLDGGTITSANGDIQIDLDNNKTIIGPTATQHIEQDGTTGALKFYANDGSSYVLAIQLDSGTSQAGDPTISTFGTTSLDKTAAEFLGDSSRPTVYMQNDGSGFALKLNGGASLSGGLSVSNGDVSLINSEISGDLIPSASGYDIGVDIGGSHLLNTWDNIYGRYIHGYYGIKIGPSSLLNIQRVYTQGVDYISIDNPRIASAAPASSTSTGYRGAIAYDSDYFYVCVATNTWKRVALSTW